MIDDPITLIVHLVFTAALPFIFVAVMTHRSRDRRLERIERYFAEMRISKISASTETPVPAEPEIERAPLPEARVVLR